MDNDFQDFVKETKFCDFSNKEINRLADKLAENCKDDREFAISAFYWVRDNILYRVGLWQRKASETLKEKKGTCTNKANLLVALLRARNIPAGYGIMKVHGQRYFGPIAIPMLKKFIGKISTHIYSLVYLNNKWIKCDPSDDKKFCENTSYFNHTTKLIEWDGYDDATLNLKQEDIISEEFPVANIDNLMVKKSKNASGLQLKIANIYIDFVRNNEKIVSGAEEIEVLFKKYLRKKYPLYFYLFTGLSFSKDTRSRFINDPMKNNLKGKKILITSGPVWVPIDKVRVITSVFGGALGKVMAENAQKMGADVLLMMGPGRTEVQSKENLKVVKFKYFDDIFDLMKKEISSKKYDIVIHSAAVPDYVPAKVYAGKIKSGKKDLIIKLKPTIKIVDYIKKWDPSVFLVKFKLQVNSEKKDLIKIAHKSMKKSEANIIVANDFSKMINNKHEAFIIDCDKIKKVDTKDNLAEELLKEISANIFSD